MQLYERRAKLSFSAAVAAFHLFHFLKHIPRLCAIVMAGALRSLYHNNYCLFLHISSNIVLFSYGFCMDWCAYKIHIIFYYDHFFFCSVKLVQKRNSRNNTFWACVSFFLLPTDVISFSIRRPHEQQTDIIFY